MEEIKVSIIVPVYNMEKYLELCLDSLVHQSLKEIEILLINDGSTDRSLKIMEKYQSEYPEKIKIYTKKNGGQGSARNIGIELSRGEYIGFVDSDDYIDLQMYETLYENAKKTGSDFVECDYQFLKVVDGQEIELPKYGEVRKRDDRKELFLNPLVSPWNKLYQGDILRNSGVKFPEGLIYEDTAFYIKMIPYIKKMCYVDQAFVKHFLRSNSTMTGNRSKRVANIFPVLEDVILYYKKTGEMENYHQELEYFCVKILLCSSMERISMVKEKNLRKELIQQTWEFIYKYFPEYKQNSYLKGGMKNLYMRVSNRWISSIFVSGLMLKNRIK